MSWLEFLKLCSEPGWLNTVIAVAEAVLLEYVPAFQALQPRWKRAVFFAISVFLPVLAAGLGVWTLGWSPRWEQTWWPALVAGVTAWLSGSGAHLLQKSAVRSI